MKKTKTEAMATTTKTTKVEVTNPEAKDIKKKKKTKAKVEETKETKKKKVIKEVAKQQKASIVEEVISNREVKYIYPEDVKDTLSRKSWRQKTRDKLRKLELDVARIKDTNSKEYKEALKEYEDYKKKVLKPEQVA